VKTLPYAPELRALLWSPAGVLPAPIGEERDWLCEQTCKPADAMAYACRQLGVGTWRDLPCGDNSNQLPGSAVRLGMRPRPSFVPKKGMSSGP
jgi:hypothetical protein